METGQEISLNQTVISLIYSSLNFFVSLCSFFEVYPRGSQPSAETPIAAKRMTTSAYAACGNKGQAKAKLQTKHNGIAYGKGEQLQGHIA